MVVDDDADIREALCDILEDEGYATIAAGNGQVALEKLHGGRKPCMILLDLMMPVMDGWKFREAQQRDPELAKIPVVVITAAGKQASALSPRVLPKPLKVEEVLQAVADYC